MSFKTRNTLLLAKIQPVAGTDPVPTAPLNAILARATKPKPINAEFEERNLDTGYLGNKGQIFVSVFSTVEFEVEFQSSGVAGTVPKYDPLLRGCSMGVTIAAGVSAVYAPISNGDELLTLTWWVGPVQHKMTDAKGTMSLSMDAKKIPFMKYTFTGLYVGPVDAAVPTTAVYTDFKAPLAINKQNTPTFTIHGIPVKANAFSLDLANQVVYKNYIGVEEVSIVDRKPAGSTTFEKDPIATKNWYATVLGGSLAPVQLIHGSVAGSIVQVDAPKVQLINPEETEADGIAMLQAGLSFIPNAGNDEFTLTFK